jgi:hypothetical protein
VTGSQCTNNVKRGYIIGRSNEPPLIIFVEAKVPCLVYGTSRIASGNSFYDLDYDPI